jgi:cystathionine beta-lyase/cystathionine gamma-synthase
VALGKAVPAPGESVDLIYSRLNHPNAEILEDQIVPLERGAGAAAVFNSGMAAISTAFFSLCAPGESFVFTTPVYGGTHHLIHTLLEPLGFKPIAVPAGDGAALERAIQGAEDLRLVFLEIPANPTLVMTDIRRAVEAARRHPRALGADLVIYSATKYLAGFSDMLEVLPVAAPFSTRTRTGSRPGSGDRSDGWRRPRPIGRRRQSGRRC